MKYIIKPKSIFSIVELWKVENNKEIFIGDYINVSEGKIEKGILDKTDFESLPLKIRATLHKYFFNGCELPLNERADYIKNTLPLVVTFHDLKEG